MGNQKPANAGKPWSEEEMFLVGSYVPTDKNIQMLAKHLGRTAHAVQYFYYKLYRKTTDLKQWAEIDTSKSEQAKKILKVRRELGLVIGM